MKLVAALFCLCLCGCASVRDVSLTGRLWHEKDCIVPSPDPQLALSQTPSGILVQYSAVSERNGDVSRRAYFLEPNLTRIANGQQPVFVDPTQAGPQTGIRIETRPRPAHSPLALYAVCASNSTTFTIYQSGEVLGPCDLPVFKDRRQTATQIALTPLAVTGDASVVAAAAGVVWAMLHASGDASGPGP